tara:strand:- start:5512 stop:6420 length:909 start_codon:yes stop_codon:yes gene_type:complete
MKLAPVVLFTFNRPKHTAETLSALVTNELVAETNLYIFSDGPRNNEDCIKIKEVRTLLHDMKSQNIFKNVIIFESKENKGLANSVISGVSQVFSEYNSVIVLEDDLIVSSDFIKYMNNALTFYENTNAGSVTGYSPLKIDASKYISRTYAIQRNCSFGWGTWKNVWDEIDWDVKMYDSYRKKYFQRREFNQSGFDRSIRLDRQMKKNMQSWSIRFGFNLFKMKKLTYYPIKSKIRPNGWDGSGVHVASGVSNFNREIGVCNSTLFEVQEVNKTLLKKIKKLYGSGLRVELKEIIFWIKNLMN